MVSRAAKIIARRGRMCLIKGTAASATTHSLKDMLLTESDYTCTI